VGNEWLIRLKRTLSAKALDQWNELMGVLRPAALSIDPDSVSWALESSGLFSSHLLYLKLNQGASVAHAKDIWELFTRRNSKSSFGSWPEGTSLPLNRSRNGMTHLMGGVCCVHNLRMLLISSSTVHWRNLCRVGCVKCSRCLGTLPVLLMFLVFSNVLMAKLVGCCGFCLQLKARRF
jgi:hypothetical protein